METDWSVACGADDPIVVVPWSDENESIRYIDLRDASGRVNEIAEAVEYPSLAAALRRWNLREASVFTAKCDVWHYAADDFDAEDLPGFSYAHASYIDLLARDPAIYASFAASEQALREWNEKRAIYPPPGGAMRMDLAPGLHSARACGWYRAGKSRTQWIRDHIVHLGIWVIAPGRGGRLVGCPSGAD